MEKQIFFVSFHSSDWFSCFSKWCCLHLNSSWNFHCIQAKNIEKFIPKSVLSKIDTYPNLKHELLILYLAAFHGGIALLPKVLCLEGFDKMIQEVKFHEHNVYEQNGIIISKTKKNKFLMKYFESVLKNGRFSNKLLKNSPIHEHFFEIVLENITVHNAQIKHVAKRHNFAFHETKLYTYNFVTINLFPSLYFIHVGKSGGTSIKYNFMKNGIYLQNYHLDRPISKRHAQSFFILWIRNPISRFVSAFYHAKNRIDGDTSLVPYRRHQDYIFSPSYDKLVSMYQTANELAENLSHSHPYHRKVALECMHHVDEHIFKGLGYYTNNGEFIHENKHRIFVGRLEYFQQDFTNLVENRLKIPFSFHYETKIRQNLNKNDTSLSRKAIENLITFYHDTDYYALKVLLQHELISKETFLSYFHY